MQECGISQLTEPIIWFDFEGEEGQNPVDVTDFTKYIIRLESDSFSLQKDNQSPEVGMDAETNSVSITLTQAETMKFDPKELIKMQVYFEIDGVPGITNILTTTLLDVLGFEGIV